MLSGKSPIENWPTQSAFIPAFLTPRAAPTGAASRHRTRRTQRRNLISRITQPLQKRVGMLAHLRRIAANAEALAIHAEREQHRLPNVQSPLPGCDFFQHVARHAERKLVLAKKYRSRILVPQQRCLFLAVGTH